ncbi:MAG: erythromycin esterase family protein [Verrucomicrobia bacterium]|nr:erythromycin esterase family protein [Verrucomicrobiota bacterium]MCH8511834.1 erythromycin esterase family protein [Kiritimatiellia bacterium]
MKPLKHLIRIPLVFLFTLSAPALFGDQTQAMREALEEIARPLNDETMTELVDGLARARIVLLGEASHGTSEFYTKRAEISKRLIREHGFNFIAVEGDWNAIHRLHLYATGQSNPEGGAREIMRGFDRWPQWMWANEETAALVEWLRAHNADLPPGEQVGIHGMDVYGMEDALRELPRAAAEIDPELGEWIAGRYRCFAPYLGDMGAYARASRAGPLSPCAGEVSAVLNRLQERSDDLKGFEGFHIQQMARVVDHAEKHYRTMGWGGATSWNHRATHFFETVRHLQEFHGEDGKGIAWAHNTHIGDARATDMARTRQHNIGQLAREHWGKDQVAALGFGTHRGTLIAGRQWGGQREIMEKPAGRAGSLEDLMHQVGPGDWVYTLGDAPEILQTPIGHRAAGVIYHPEREHLGNYVTTILPERYDFFLFLEETKALAPVDSE